MKRFVSLFIFCLLTGLCACSSASAPEAPSADSSAPEPTAQVFAPREDWAEVYTAFLAENHETLTETCFGGVAGVGFIDLDLDNTPEMVLFDSGASAYMGVQLFDLTDSGVVCVSASSVETGLTFGGQSLSPLYVNALFFDDFRLMEGEDGHRWFQVVSRNGAEDFYYHELLRFAPGENGCMTVESVWYKHLTVDPATGLETFGSYTAAGEAVDAEGLAAAERAADADGWDTEYTADGAFLWTDKRFGYDREGLMAMAAEAVARYVPIE